MIVKYVGENRYSYAVEEINEANASAQEKAEPIPQVALKQALLLELKQALWDDAMNGPEVAALVEAAQAALGYVHVPRILEPLEAALCHWRVTDALSG